MATIQASSRDAGPGHEAGAKNGVFATDEPGAPGRSPRRGQSLEIGMSPQEVIRFLQSRESTDYDKNYYTLKRIVSENPAEYSRLARRMPNMSGVFRSGLFEALSASDAALDWESVLELCGTMLDGAGRTESIDSLLDDCGTLLRKNLKPGRIPFELRQNAWSVLDRATKLALSDPSPYESRGSNPSAFIACINSGTGETALAIVQYSVWCYFGLKAGGHAPDRLPEEAKTALESLLGSGGSPLVHAAMGLGFAELMSIDRAWASKRAGTVFVRGHPAGDAAWESYVRNRVHPASFKALFQEYVYRLGATSRLETLEMTADHVVVAHLHCLGDTDVLIDSIIEKKDGALLSYLVRRMGQSASRWPGSGSGADVGAFALRKEVLANPSAGWLFLNKRMADKDRLDMLDRTLAATGGKIDPASLVLEDLKPMASSYPAKTVACVERIASIRKADDGIFSLLAVIYETLQAALETKNAEAERAARRVANALGAYGFERFRRLS